MNGCGARPGRGAVEWSADLAYAVGLLATDGCLSKDGRHILFVSKDREQLQNLMRALGLERVRVGYTVSGLTGKKTTRIQFSDVVLWRFLVSIGVMPNKSKIIADVAVPDPYFFDFLRGCFDGDGSCYFYWDSRWKSSFMFYTSFASASEAHITWLRERIGAHLSICGHVTRDANGSTIQLKYAKADSLKILKSMYHSPHILHLTRKRLKVDRILRIIGEQLC